MSDDSHPSTSTTIVLPSDDPGVTTVLAHSMLGSVAAIRGAIDTAMAHGIPAAGRDGVLLLAQRRLDFLTMQLRALAAGVPADAVVVLDGMRGAHPDVLLGTGTRVELFSAFNRTWTAGFEVAGVVAGRYRIRRISDGAMLPGYTSPSDLRAQDPRIG